MSNTRRELAEKSAREFMKAVELGTHDGVFAKAVELYLCAWDAAIHQAAMELKALEKHDEADEVLKLR